MFNITVRKIGKALVDPCWQNPDVVWDAVVLLRLLTHPKMHVASVLDYMYCTMCIMHGLNTALSVLHFIISLFISFILRSHTHTLYCSSEVVQVAMCLHWSGGRSWHSTRWVCQILNQFISKLERLPGEGGAGHRRYPLILIKGHD